MLIVICSLVFWSDSRREREDIFLGPNNYTKYWH